MTTEKLVAGPLRGAIEAMRQHHCKPWNGEMHSAGACTICDVIYALASLPSSPPPPKWGAEIAARAEFGELEAAASPVQGVPKCPRCGSESKDNPFDEGRRLCLTCCAGFDAPAGQRAEGAEAATELQTAWMKLLEAANCVRHWHDSGTDGMVVSKEHVFKLWEARDEVEALLAAAPPVAEKTELDQAGLTDEEIRRRKSDRDRDLYVAALEKENATLLAALGSGQELREALDFAAVLRKHWLAGIECHHALIPGDKAWDRASCACSEVEFPKAENVGEAVEMWIQHVLVVAALALPFAPKVPPTPPPLCCDCDGLSDEDADCDCACHAERDGGK